MNVTSDPEELSILPMGVQGPSWARAPWEQLSETEGAQPVVMVTRWRQTLGVGGCQRTSCSCSWSHGFISAFLPFPHIQQTCTTFFNIYIFNMICVLGLNHNHRGSAAESNVKSGQVPINQEMIKQQKYFSENPKTSDLLCYLLIYFPVKLLF